MEFRTTKCKEKGHREISIFLSRESGQSPDWLLNYFEAEVFNGRIFLAGQTVQVGWMVNLIRGGRDTLEVWEPRFDSMPIQWERQADNTLRHLVLQTGVLECRARFPSLRQAAVIAPGFLTNTGTFSLSRDEPSENDSGWVFKEQDYFGSEGEYRSLFEVSIHHAHIIPFLALPAGTRITTSLGAVEVEWNGRRASSESNIFLHQLMDARHFS